MTVISYNDFEKKLLSLISVSSSLEIAVAVSGGADSLCLAFFLHEFITKNGGTLVSLIVDHKLRSESAEEAQYVKKILTDHNIDTVILERESVPLISKIQEQARKDRYNILLNYCYEHNIPYLLVAHHLNDQLETMVMREEKGKNIIGTSGMSAKVVSEKVTILRPFLKYSKQDILDTIVNFTKIWVEDPSNKNDKYHRVRIRKILYNQNTNTLEELKNHLLKNIEKRKILEHKVLTFFANNVILTDYGMIKLLTKDLANISQDVLIIAIRNILQFISGKEYSSNINKVKNLLNEIRDKKRFRISLNYCFIEVRKNFIFFYKEPNKVKHTLMLGQDKSKIWDNRFVCNNSSSFTIGKIGVENYSKIRRDKKIKEFIDKNEINFYNINTIPWYFNKDGNLLWQESIKNIYFKSFSNLINNNFTTI